MDIYEELKLYFGIRIVILLSIFCLTSCLEEITFEAGTDEPQLVVEATVSNEFESYKVRLSTLFELNGVGSNTLGTNAQVTIREIGGSDVLLSETSPGFYETFPGEIIGEIGKSYQLLIQLANGESYESTIEEILPPISIKNGEASYSEERFEQQNGTFRTVISHDITLEIDNEDQDHFYIVDGSGWAEVDIGYGDCFADAPVGPAKCWSFRDQIITNSLSIGTNSGLSGEDYFIKTTKIPFDAKGRYVAMVRLLSMSSSYFSFWSSITDQLNRPGGLFDRPFAPIVGNIRNTNDGLPALGYFQVYSISEQIVCFDRSNVRASVSFPISIPCPVLCTEVWAPATFDDVTEDYCE